MINTKALTIRLGYSRFWRTKFVPSNFYENYHYFYLEKFFEDFFSQKIFHSIGFVYGHSVIKYFPNFMRVEVFVHDFRLEEFSKNFFTITKKNFRKRNRFRKKFFRPLFRKIFSFFKRNESHINFRRKKKKFFSKYNSNDVRVGSSYSNKKVSFNNSFSSSNTTFKKFFSKFKSKYKKVSSNNSFFKKKKRKMRYSYCLKSVFSFFTKVYKFIKKFKIFVGKTSTFNSYKIKYFKKNFINIYKIFSIFKILYLNHFKNRILTPLFCNSSNFFKNNSFIFFKKIKEYDRFKLFNHYSFSPYSKDFIKRNVVKRVKKSEIIKRLKNNKTNFDNFSLMFLNVKSNGTYYHNFLHVFKNNSIFKFSFNNVNKFLKKKFKNIYKLIFSNVKLAPFTKYSFLSTFSNSFFSLSNVIFRKIKLKRKLNFFAYKKKGKKKRKMYFFRFHRRFKKKGIRHFLPFFSRFRKLSYIYFRFFRFKFYKFVCNYISRNFNTKFLGMPVKFFIRVIPAFRTTSNIFLRYFITKLFYRYMLGDVLNPIVRSSMRRFRGFTVVANGRFTRAQMASHRHYKRGSVSFSSISIPIDYNQICIPLKYGTCNLKLWIRY
jgi:hypothetical protein